MADPNMNKNNETMQREQAKASVAGDRKPEAGKSDEDRREQGRIDKEGREQGREQGREKSAIGGGEKGQTSGQPSGQSSGQGSQIGEPGRSRSELDQSREADKSRSEPTSR